MLSRSQTEQLWPSSRALQSMFLGKTRIMSLENVSTHLLLFVGTSFVQSWVAGKALQTEGGPVVSLFLRGAPARCFPKRWQHRVGGTQLLHLGTGTPMLEDVDEGGIRPWHLVKPSEEPEPPRPRRGSLRGGERERAKAIPEIYLTRLLSMKVGLGY